MASSVMLSTIQSEIEKAVDRRSAKTESHEPAQGYYQAFDRLRNKTQNSQQKLSRLPQILFQRLSLDRRWKEESMKYQIVQKIRTLFLVASTVAVMTATHSLPAQMTSSGRIYNARSEKCLQPLNASKAPGTPIVLADCNSSDAQFWYRTPAKGTSGDIVHYVNAFSGLCLDAKGSAANNTPVQLWTCNQITNENWQYEQTSTDTEPKVVSRVSGTSNYCLDIPGGGTNDGLALQIYICNGSPAQHFYTP
jgi:hypothetical protein